MVEASVKAMAAPRSNKAQRAVSGSGSGGTQWGSRTKNQRLGPMLPPVLVMALVESSSSRALQHKAKERKCAPVGAGRLQFTSFIFKSLSVAPSKHPLGMVGMIVCLYEGENVVNLSPYFLAVALLTL